MGSDREEEETTPLTEDGVSDDNEDSIHVPAGKTRSNRQSTLKTIASEYIPIPILMYTLLISFGVFVALFILQRNSSQRPSNNVQSFARHTGEEINGLIPECK